MKLNVPSLSVTSVLPYALLLLVLIVGNLVIEGLLSPTSVMSLLVIASLLGIASIGQTLVILLGGIDLAIPAVIGMANVMLVQLVGNGFGFWSALLVVFGTAAIVGALNAFLVRVTRANALIITLAMSSIVIGLITGWSRAESSAATLPDWLVTAVSPVGTTGPIPVPFIVVCWTILAIVVICVQRATTLGKRIYAIGANPVAARIAGMRASVIWFAVFIISSLAAAVSGVFLAGFSGGADSSVGSPYLFLTVSAVVVGGTSLLGGQGGYGRTVVGTILIAVLTTVLIGLGFADNVQQMLLGVLIIAVVAIYGRQTHVRNQI